MPAGWSTYSKFAKEFQPVMCVCVCVCVCDVCVCVCVCVCAWGGQQIINTVVMHCLDLNLKISNSNTEKS